MAIVISLIIGLSSVFVSVASLFLSIADVFGVKESNPIIALIITLIVIVIIIWGTTLVVKVLSENYIKEHDLSSLANENELIIVCKDAIKNNKQIIQQYKSGNEKSMNFLVGIVMKETRGRADPKRIREIIFSLI